MSKQPPKIITIAFVNAVDLPNSGGELSWRDDQHGPVKGRKCRTTVSIGQGLVTIRPVPPEPDAVVKAEDMPALRTIVVPLTNVRFWLFEE